MPQVRNSAQKDKRLATPVAGQAKPTSHFFSLLNPRTGTRAAPWTREGGGHRLMGLIREPDARTACGLGKGKSASDSFKAIPSVTTHPSIVRDRQLPPGGLIGTEVGHLVRPPGNTDPYSPT